MCLNSFSNARDLALNHYREHIMMHNKVQPKILKRILDMISQERRGESVDRDILRSIIRMYSDLQVINVSILNRLLESHLNFLISCKNVKSC